MALWPGKYFICFIWMMKSSFIENFPENNSNNIFLECLVNYFLQYILFTYPCQWDYKYFANVLSLWFNMYFKTWNSLSFLLTPVPGALRQSYFIHNTWHISLLSSPAFFQICFYPRSCSLQAAQPGFPCPFFYVLELGFNLK